ncbi:heme biosynthesis HemY N-terminal domain-containing protein [Leeia sp.]|uniref:heme biosynthesis HemY N-terminal domain-containing protein n=1 Tax=Leeia sp. TaxID=2884678 RepID=UPI0035B4F8E1
MRALFWTLLLFVLAVVLALLSRVNTGYAILIVPPYRIDISFNTFVFLTVLAFIVAYFIIRAAATTLALPQKVRDYHRSKRRNAAQKSLLDALLAYFEGRYSRAERLASQTLELEESPQSRAISALLAAAAADSIKNTDKRDAYLARSELATPDTHLARLMVQASLQLKAHRYEEALETLHTAKNIAPKLTTALRLELTARQQLGQFAHVLPLIAQLEKSEAINPVQAEQLRKHAFTRQLRDEVQELVPFRRFWSKLPADYRLDSKMALTAARKLTDWQQWEDSRSVLTQALQHGWEPALVLALSQLPADAPADEVLARVQQAEAWLEQHPQDASLLLALGRLCRQQQLWGKARSYLEASLAVAPSAVTHIELARLLTQLDEASTAQLHFEAAASAVEQALADQDD